MVKNQCEVQLFPKTILEIYSWNDYEKIFLLVILEQVRKFGNFIATFLKKLNQS